jgi:hypothetical protein
MPECAQNYFSAIADPFGYFTHDRAVCIPDQEAAPSYKVSVVGRGTFQTSSTTGDGFVAFNPDAAYKDTYSIAYSTASYTGTAIADSGVGVTQSLLTRLPFQAASVLLHRTVAAGLRVRNISQRLYRNGALYLGTATSATDDLVGTTENSLAGRPNTTFESASDGKWHTCTYYATDTLSTDWRADNPNITDAVRMAALVSGDIGQSQTFQYEIVLYKEYRARGAITVPGASASDSDMLSFGAIRNFMSQLSQIVPGRALLAAGFKAIEANLASVLVPRLTAATAPLLLGL